MKTTRILYAYRIGDPHGIHPIYDAEGSRLYPGRWNSAACPVIYTSEHYATAMLEKLVHANGLMPPNQHFIKITIPTGTSYEMFQPARYPGWDGRDERICKQVGDDWRDAKRSALLFVPSIPAREEDNILINPDHSDSKAIDHDLPRPIWWDTRLYGGG